MTLTLPPRPKPVFRDQLRDGFTLLLPVVAHLVEGLRLGPGPGGPAPAADDDTQYLLRTAASSCSATSQQYSRYP